MGGSACHIPETALIPARPEFGMQAHHSLQEGQRRQQLLAPHVLRPGDPLAQHERFIAAEVVQAAQGGTLRRAVAQQDVRGELRPAHVQDVKPFPFPFLRGAEVKHCADQRLAAVMDKLSGRTDPLEAVDDVHIAGDRVRPIGVGASVAFTADGELHIGHASEQSVLWRSLRAAINPDVRNRKLLGIRHRAAPHSPARSLPP